MSTIDVQRYCNLSKEIPFQEWLKSVSEDLYNELMTHLNKNESCSSNKNKMKIIHAKLKAMDKFDNLVNFIKLHYPHLIVRSEVNSLSKTSENKEVKVEDLNFHKIFPKYSEKLLTFPQRKIFVGDSYVNVNNKIINFIQNYASPDYVILENNGVFHGYVEYFDKKYEKIISQLPMEKRFIHVYKTKNGLL